MIPGYGESYEEREDDDDPPSDRPKSERVVGYMLKSRSIFVGMSFCHLSNSDRIESEIGNGGEYRQVIIDLRIQTESLNAQILGEESYEEDRDEGSTDFSEDLRSCIGKYFSHDTQVLRKSDLLPDMAICIVEVESIAAYL